MFIRTKKIIISLYYIIFCYNINNCFNVIMDNVENIKVLIKIEISQFVFIPIVCKFTEMRRYLRFVPCFPIVVVCSFSIPRCRQHTAQLLLLSAVTTDRPWWWNMMRNID